MSYLVLARKWRPQQLEDILGQDHVTRTLGNALESGRVAHAFLFTGARGVGKTSAARILAKALCCEAGPGPTRTPCGECGMCLEIAGGSATDVFEIDAASNTGVGNIREIIDNCRYLPAKARFKIYVIDEVHMLSTGAFNALLKTLEEPPSHVKFILATTDVHKVPVTIRSRCQRYDFRRIPQVAISERLSQILDSEGVEHDASALSLVAREAEGSMRDAQSLLEQVLTFAGGRALERSLVRDALGVADRAILGGLIEAILGRSPGATLEHIRDVHDRGLDLKRFSDALVEYARDLLVARLAEHPERILDLPSDERDALVRVAQGMDSVELERLFDRLTSVVESVAESPYPRFVLEVGLASLAEAPARVPVDALIAQLDRIEAQLSGSGAGSGGAAASGSFRGRQASSVSGSGSQVRGGGASERVVSGGRSSQGGAAFVAPRPPAPRPPAPPASPARAFEAPAPPAPPPVVEAAASVEAAIEPSESGVATDAGPLSFDAFVATVMEKRPTLSGMLSQVRPLRFEAGAVELGCQTSFDVSTLGDSSTAKYLEGLLAEHFGAPTSLVVSKLERASTESVPPTLDEVRREAMDGRRQEKVREARRNPKVRALVDELGARVGKVRLTD